LSGQLRVGQIGTRHGHARGKWQALLRNPRVEAVGLFEPEAARRDSDAFPQARWFESAAALLEQCDAVAIEGRNFQSLGMARQAIEAGKHLWFDKPAGDDWPAFAQLMDAAASQRLYVQMGYMFRYSPPFMRIAELARSGALGDVFSVRAHMSTAIKLAEKTEQSRHEGGILYDLGGHMLDQVVWLLGRPERVSAVLRNDATPELPTYSDNTLGVLQFSRALAMVDIAAMEPAPTARRFEVYGTRGSAILEGFDPPRTLRLLLDGRVDVLELEGIPRQEMYNRELEAFVGVLQDGRPPDRPPEHERLVQETLLRLTRGWP
jgi:predicted dehydrogenase